MGREARGFTRRQFLIAAGAGLAIGAGAGPGWLPAKEEYDLAVISGEPAAATRRALEALGGISRFVKKGQRVVLKPNMSFANPPDRGSTTHPAVVVEVARACLEAGVQRVVVTGSFSAVGHHPDRPSDESVPFNPFERSLPYGFSKAAVEHECLKAFADGLPVVVATSCAILGPNDFKPCSSELYQPIPATTTLYEHQEAHRP